MAVTEITDAEVLRAVLAGSGVRVTAFDRDGSIVLDPDPNPPLPSDSGAPPGANYFELYGSVPGMLEAVQAAFAGETVPLTREFGGAIYHGAFVPRTAPSGEIDAVFAMAETVPQGSAEQRALAEMQSRERRIFNSNMTGLLYWDQEGRVTDANAAFLEMLGYDRSDLSLGRINWRTLTPPEHKAVDDAALAAIRDHGTCPPFEKEYIHKDGRRISVLVGASSWGKGQPAGVAFVVDISDRRRAQAEQERLRAQFLQAQKLESLGLLAGGIAHDFNNILTVILGSASTALLEIPRDTQAHRDVSHVLAAAQQAAGLTRQMLAFAGKAPIEVSAIDLSLKVREIVVLLQATLPKKVELRLELEEQLPAIDADVSQIQQVVMNLVINAAEAIGTGAGTVWIRTVLVDVNPATAPQLYAGEGPTPGRYVVLEVRDTGHGMDDATRAKIFDPFFSTKFTGRGLGLGAVLGITRSHRGAIEVASTPGVGTCFRVFFPAAHRKVASEPRTPARESEWQGLVLLIDDDPGVRRSSRRMLESLGFTVMEASDGIHGLQTFRTHAQQIALVVVDMTMPKMNGEETVRALRGIRQDVPVLLCSGYSELETSGRFSDARLIAFLQKPFTRDALAASLNHVFSAQSRSTVAQ